VYGQSQSLAVADRVIAMNFGTLLAEGPPWEVLLSDEVSESYLVEDARALLGPTRSEQA
jgi:ABC-type lipopolysaccharide export system ATPase subunit